MTDASQIAIDIAQKVETEAMKEGGIREVVEAEEEVRPENIPLPTDSMVTVRLSDPQLLADPQPIETFSERQSLATDGRDTTSNIIPPASRPSSRASSNSSQGSSISISVDWEGLEKTEEEELKDDATDEVRKMVENMLRS